MSAKQTAPREHRPAAKFRPRPGRPSAEQAAAIANAILTAATEIFLSHGFEAASMEAIAQAANIPKSTLYKRYADKRALLAAVIDVRVEAWSANSSRRNSTLGDSLEQRLKRLCIILLTRATDPEIRAYSRLAASAWSAPSERARRHDVIGFSSMLDFLEAEIRQRSAAEGIRARSPRRVATALMAMLAGWLELREATMPVRRQDALAFAHTAVDLLMKGAADW